MYVPQYDNDGVTLTVTAAPTPPPPTNTTPPSVSGTPAVGDTLTCGKGAWSHNPTHFTYRWKRNGKAITGATHRTYVIQAADQGHTLTCTVVASNAGGPSTQSTSKGVAVPAPPKCTLKSKRRVTITFRKVAGKKTINGGILPVQITCNQKAATKLTATLTDHPSGGATKHYRLAVIRKTVRKGSRTVVKLKLPAAAVTDLVHGATESVAAALAAHGRTGTSRITATFSPLTK
jgi:hypothetical protein